jgi:adenylosuccinate synthase
MRHHEQRNRIVIGLGFGDEAKGSTVDYLCSLGGVSSVVRFNGGGQAAHNVIVDGKHHTFRQFGSGTLAGVPTFLSRFFLINPWQLAAESEDLGELGVVDPLGLITVSPDALVVTPVHIAANRSREDLRGADRHGSCGLGIGETVWYDLAARQGLAAGETLFDIMAMLPAAEPALRVKDCFDPQTLRDRLMALTAFYAPLIGESRHGHPTVREMSLDLMDFIRAVKVRDDAGHISALAVDGSLVFEGAQGVLLDEWRGFHPHTTWSSTLPLNAQALLAEAGQQRAEVVGVLRAYGTRHGAGPFPTEDPALKAALPEPHNGEGRYQGAWRTGHLDLVALRYAAEVCREHGGLDALALTHLDTLAAQEGNVRVALRYDGIAEPFPLGDYRDLAHQEKLRMSAQTAVPVLEPLIAAEVLGLVQDVLGAPVRIVAHGPRREDRRTP